MRDGNHHHGLGILAAAVAGIVMHYSELAGRPSAATRMQRHAVWDTLQTTLNGIIFVLLGEHLPRVVSSLPSASKDAGYGVANDDDAAKAKLAVDQTRALRLQALSAERDELHRVRLAGDIDDDVYRRLVREIDLVEASLLQQTAAAH